MISYIIYTILLLYKCICADVLSSICTEHDSKGAYAGQIHFSPPYGFMNDPNGLFRDAEDTYHLYYQWNPTGLVAGNQHWGHATSKDLYQWRNEPIALSPAMPDEGIFSGSAVIDPNNTSGFFPNQQNGVVAVYTLSTPTEQAQHIAYSLDGGYTFTKYSFNPVISIDSTEFRDPKVFWHAPSSHWVLVIAYAREYTIGIWTSTNLRNWNHASNFSNAGLLGLQYECPNLVPMPMLRNSSLKLPELVHSSNIEANAKLWIMFISINPGAPLGGSISQYIPGYFNGTHFTPVDSAARLSDFGKDNYAGQFFAGIDSGVPQISMQWASNWQYTNEVPTDSDGFRGMMALPRAHVLANTSRSTYSLFSIPQPFEHLYTSAQPLMRSDSIANRSLAFEYSAVNPDGALSFTLIARAIPSEPRGSLNFTLLSSITGENIRGGYIMTGDSTFYLDRSGVRGFISPFFTGQFSAAHPVDSDTGCFRMHVVVDRSIIEVFLDNGARSATMVFFSESPLDVLLLSTGDLGTGVRVEAEVWGLRSSSSGKIYSAKQNASQTLEPELMDKLWI